MSAMRQTPLTCSGHTRPVVHLAFSQIINDEYFLISACKDGKPMLRKGDTGDWIGTFEGHKGAVWGVALNNDASKAATGAADFQAKIWDAQSGEELLSFPHQHIVKSVDFSPDGEMLLTGSNEKILRLFNIQRPDAGPLLFSGHTNSIRHAVFLQDSRRVASCSDDKTLRFWDRLTGKELSQLMFPSVPSSVEVFADGQLLSVSHGSSVSFWDTNRMEKFKEFKVPCTVNSVSLHPDKSVFVCGGDDFKMYKNDFNSGSEIESFKGHFGPVHCVRFSPDGELYASGSEDGTLRLWQTTVGKSYGLWKGSDDAGKRNGSKEDGIYPEQA